MQFNIYNPINIMLLKIFSYSYDLEYQLKTDY